MFLLKTLLIVPIKLNYNSPWSIPPDQIPPNLTQNLTLTQVRIHRGELTRGEFSGYQKIDVYIPT